MNFSKSRCACHRTRLWIYRITTASVHKKDIARTATAAFKVSILPIAALAKLGVVEVVWLVGTNRSGVDSDDVVVVVGVRMLGVEASGVGSGWYVVGFVMGFVFVVG